MTVHSIPVCVSKPRDSFLPPHLQAYSLDSHRMRERPISNSSTYQNPHEDDDDWGGDPLEINILSHDGLPSVELCLFRVPTGKWARKIRRAAEKARSIAADKQLDGMKPVSPDSHRHEHASCKSEDPCIDTEKKPEKPKKIRACQISADVAETLETLKKVMPNKRLNEKQMAELAAVLSKHKAAFAKDSKDYGKVTPEFICHHSIAIDDAKPVFQKPYRHSKFEEDFLKALVAELQEIGLIRPTSSPWISPVVLVKKKDGGLRMCIDFRRLNAVTKRDPYQLPRVDDLTDRMQGCSYFSSIDVLSAFWNVPMAEEDIEKTGFTTAFGNFEWTRMPFGLINASSTFQRLMDKVTSGLKNAAAYIDDVFIFSMTWEEHLQALSDTLGRLTAAGLKCKLSKCSFGGDSVKCLGHEVSQKGVTIEYSRATLESRAIESNRLAMEAVRASTSYVPVMGFTHRNMTEFQTSGSNTEVFDISGIMYEEADDCDCQYCQDIHSEQRFPGPAS